MKASSGEARDFLKGSVPSDTGGSGTWRERMASAFSKLDIVL